MKTATKARRHPAVRRHPWRSLARCLPALGLMALIFGLSSIPSSQMPSFGLWDRLIKKGAHAIGYGFLALAYWHARQWRQEDWKAALLLTLAYALSDEFHQAFVPGRHASITDALLVDGSGACLALLLARTWQKHTADSKQPHSNSTSTASSSPHSPKRTT